MPDTREVELGSELWELEQKKKAVAAELKEINDSYRVKAEEMQELLVESGKSSTGHIQGVGEFKLAPKAYLSVSKANMEQFIAHLKAAGDGALVKEMVESQTLKAYLAQKCDELANNFSEDLDYFRMVCKEHNIEDPDSVTFVEVAAKELTKYGVSQFSEVKLSHLQKGK